MPFFRTKSVVKEARLFDGTIGTWSEILHWMNPSNPIIPAKYRYDTAHNTQIHTAEGVMQASPGDWIIKGLRGEFYPCKPDVFAATYEPAPPNTGTENGDE